MITVAIAEDHQALIDGIKSFLEFDESVKIVGHANDGEQLLELVSKKEPKIILCDIRMPKMDGIEACKVINKNYTDTNVIAFTMFDQEDAVQQMLDAGAKGYVLKNSSLKVLVEAITTVAKGQNYFDKKIHLPNAKKNTSSSPLSSRENQILNLIGQRKTSDEIASLLFITEATVNTHRKNMIEKLGLKGRGALLQYALDRKYRF